jgi:hypothetical protein
VRYTFIFRKQFYFVMFDLKIIGHGNPDSNLESPCSTHGIGEKCAQNYNRKKQLKITLGRTGVNWVHIKEIAREVRTDWR